MKNYCCLAVLICTMCVPCGIALADADDSENEVPGEVVSVVIQKESKGNDLAVGDKKDRFGNPKPSSQWAYGPLQISWRCVKDVNKHYGTHYKAEDCLGDRELSVLIFKKYMKIYATHKTLGHNPKAEDYFGIWNGGPSGWKNYSTRVYVAKAMAMLSKLT